MKDEMSKVFLDVWKPAASLDAIIYGGSLAAGGVYDSILKDKLQEAPDEQKLFLVNRLFVQRMVSRYLGDSVKTPSLAGERRLETARALLAFVDYLHGFTRQPSNLEEFIALDRQWQAERLLLMNNPTQTMMIEAIAVLEISWSLLTGKGMPRIPYNRFPFSSYTEFSNRTKRQFAHNPSEVVAVGRALGTGTRIMFERLADLISGIEKETGN